tara:strand:+ start:101 stop:520 length:420 start_codon:yes stop_codon:yes gene_type:complete
MKKNDLKQLIKPLVKECIHEVLIEEGLLANVVSEVAKGLQGSLIVETQAPTRAPPPRDDDRAMRQQAKATRQKMNNRRQELMDSIGGDAYNGVNLFEGSTPIANDQSSQGQADLGDPRDGGVDISELIGGAKHIWGAMK